MRAFTHRLWHRDVWRRNPWPAGGLRSPVRGQNG